LFCCFFAGRTYVWVSPDNPEWGRRSSGVNASIHFDAQGFNRTYWDFFSAFGLFFSVFLLFAAVLACCWGDSRQKLWQRVRSISWALAILLCRSQQLLAGDIAFTTPIVFST